MNDFLGIALVGAALSLFVEFLQNKYGIESRATKAMVMALSLVVGFVYVYISKSSLYQTVLGVFGAASTVYVLFFKK